MVRCYQLCNWNYPHLGCVKPNDEICPMSNIASQEKQQTNADRIRAMSDEELADWVARTQIDNVAEALKIAGIPWEKAPGLQDEVKKDVLEWLKQPVKENDNSK